VYQPEYDVEEITLPKIATDDSHRDPHFGRAWIEVDASRTPDAIIKAIKAGDFHVGFAPGAREAGGRLDPFDYRACLSPPRSRQRLTEAPILRRSMSVSSGAIRVSRPTSFARNDSMTTSLIAPSQVSVASRVSTGGMALSATASSRYAWIRVAKRPCTSAPLASEASPRLTDSTRRVRASSRCSAKVSRPARSAAPTFSSAPCDAWMAVVSALDSRAASSSTSARNSASLFGK